MRDSVVQELLAQGRPVDRENYLKSAGLEEPLEAELPPELRKTSR